MPKQFIEQYKNLILEFIWDKKKHKIKYKATNTFEEGEFTLQDVECKINYMEKTFIQTGVTKIYVLNKIWYITKAK